MDDIKSKVVELDLNDILPNRFQPRIKFNEDSIIELSESIKEHGVIQPIIVRPIGDKYEIIAGERRYKASVLAGKETIPAIISSLNDKDSAEVALIENVQRRDLTPIEEAVSYKKILDMGYLTQEQLATKLGKSQSAVANKIRLLNLCDEAQESLMEEKISERHARSLLKIHEVTEQKKMLERIINERLTVRKTEEEIEKMNSYITEPLEESSNTNPIPAVNPGFVNTSIEEQPSLSQPENKSVDFNSLLMSESDKNSMGGIPTVSPFGVASEQKEELVVPTPAPFIPAAPETSIFGTSELGVTNSSLGTTTPAPSDTFSFGVQPKENNEVEVSTPPMPSPIEPTPFMGSLFGENKNNEQVVAPVEPKVVTESATNPFLGADLTVPTSSDSSLFGGMPTTPIVENSTVASASMMDVSPTPLVDVPVTPAPEAPEEDKKLSFADLLAPSSPVVESQPAPIPPTPDFDTLISQPPKMDPTPTVAPVMPTTPIMENKLPDAFADPSGETESDDGTAGGITSVIPNEEPVSVPTEDTVKTEEKVDIQPIIITDYSKQYDPVLPEQPKPVEKIDFKQIIGLIRDVNNTIEKCGYTVETEEYDLENEYQVIFKINKN